MNGVLVSQRFPTSILTPCALRDLEGVDVERTTTLIVHVVSHKGSAAGSMLENIVLEGLYALGVSKDGGVGGRGKACEYRPARRYVWRIFRPEPIGQQILSNQESR